jgi:hypothetical protein
MNTKRAMKWSLLVASAGCLAVANMPGCELLVTFDRSKIPDDSGLADGAEFDGQFNPDAISSTEGGPGSDAEAAPDGQSEASSSDATSETSTADAPATDTSTSGGDGGTQGTADAGAEAAVDGGGGGGADSAAEAATDSGGG